MILCFLCESISFSYFNVKRYLLNVILYDHMFFTWGYIFFMLQYEKDYRKMCFSYKICFSWNITWKTYFIWKRYGSISSCGYDNFTWNHMKSYLICFLHGVTSKTHGRRPRDVWPRDMCAGGGGKEPGSRLRFIFPNAKRIGLI